MKIYKIIRVENRKRVSCFLNGAAKISYSTKKYVRAPYWLEKYGYYPTAFLRLKDAREFWTNDVSSIFGAGFELWEADGIGIKRKLPNRCDEIKAGGWSFLGTGLPWPPGTIMAEKIKLIRRIEKWRKKL